MTSGIYKRPASGKDGYYTEEEISVINQTPADGERHKPYEIQDSLGHGHELRHFKIQSRKLNLMAIRSVAPVEAFGDAGDEAEEFVKGQILGKLKKFGIEERHVLKIVHEHGHPPCFEGRQGYLNWLSACADSNIPIRYDVPSEPNYCRDCTVSYQKKMVAEGRCLFKHTVSFEKSMFYGDADIGGVTRAPRVLPKGMIMSNQLMVTGTAALDERAAKRSFMRRQQLEVMGKEPSSKNHEAAPYLHCTSDPLFEPDLQPTESRRPQAVGLTAVEQLTAHSPSEAPLVELPEQEP